MKVSENDKGLFMSDVTKVLVYHILHFSMLLQIYFYILHEQLVTISSSLAKQFSFEKCTLQFFSSRLCIYIFLLKCKIFFQAKSQVSHNIKNCVDKGACNIDIIIFHIDHIFISKIETFIQGPWGPDPTLLFPAGILKKQIFRQINSITYNPNTLKS